MNKWVVCGFFLVGLVAIALIADDAIAAQASKPAPTQASKPAPTPAPASAPTVIPIGPGKAAVYTDPAKPPEIYNNVNGSMLVNPTTGETIQSNQAPPISRETSLDDDDD